MLLLTVDVGNTNISYGVFDGDQLVLHMRTESARSRTSDEFAVLVRQMMSLRGVEPDSVTAAIVASVVPPLNDTILDFIELAFDCEATLVGPGIKTGMKVQYDNPHDVGADRIVNAVAAYEWSEGGVIVVDFGTATTFDCISPRAEYLGGVITPGIEISADALFTRASRLHRVEIARPDRVVGRNTAASMQSGIVFGYAGLVDGLCERLREELGFPCRVLATGGMAELICPETRVIEHVDHHLTLTGLRLIHERNQR
ncbi:MAG: type III pantothenate kinase [Myxococcota bacterium]